MRPDFVGLVGESDSMQRVFVKIRRFADSHLPVVLVGETGTGKELCAKALWRRGGGKRPFVPVNCAAIPENLIDSRLFGHLEGAFTGATEARTGLVTKANGGILFLDEIMELGDETQSRLLRVLEEGEYRRVGGDRVLKSDFRLIAATQTPPRDLVQRGRFREDFFHRLGLLRIELPPLRDRRHDITRLAHYFLSRYLKRCGRHRPSSFRADALALLQEPEWRGNVRQLLNVVEASAAVTSGDQIGPETLLDFLPLEVPGSPPEPGPGAMPTLEEAVLRAEERTIVSALTRTNGNKLEAAELLNVSESTLYRKINRIRERRSGSALDLASAAFSGAQD